MSKITLLSQKVLYEVANLGAELCNIFFNTIRMLCLRCEQARVDLCVKFDGFSILDSLLYHSSVLADLVLFGALCMGFLVKLLDIDKILSLFGNVLGGIRGFDRLFHLLLSCCSSGLNRSEGRLKYLFDWHAF